MPFGRGRRSALPSAGSVTTHRRVRGQLNYRAGRGAHSRRSEVRPPPVRDTAWGPNSPPARTSFRTMWVGAGSTTGPSFRCRCCTSCSLGRAAAAEARVGVDASAEADRRATAAVPAARPLLAPHLLQRLLAPGRRLSAEKGVGEGLAQGPFFGACAGACAAASDAPPAPQLVRCWAARRAGRALKCGQ